MQSWKRGFLRPVLALAVVAALTASGGALYLLRLPHPSQANRQQLLRWLVARDLSSEPRSVSVALVDRLQTVLQQDQAQLDQLSDAAAQSLSESQWSTVQENTEYLKQLWFEIRCQQYDRCQSSQRMPFLDRQIEFILTWSQVDWTMASGRTSPDQVDSTARERFAEEFFAKIEQWMDAADSSARQLMDRAVQDGLVCWLATRDLQDEPMGTRQALASRVARQLDAGLRMNEVAPNLTEDQQAHLRNNGLLLTEAWLLGQAELFRQCEAHQREAFIDQRIDQVLRWNLLDWIAAPSDAGRPLAIRLASFLQLVQQWIQRAPQEQQEPLRQMVQQVQQRLVIRQFQGQLPSR